MKHSRCPRQYIERNTERITESGCWIWMGSISEKYGYAFINWKYYAAHRLAWIAFRGPIPDGLLVLHRCDIHLCCNPAHLFIGTHADNMDDMKCKQRQARGESHPAAKLTAEQVLAIRAADASYGNLAQRFNVTKGMIAHIRKGRAWKHV